MKFKQVTADEWADFACVEYGALGAVVPAGGAHAAFRIAEGLADILEAQKRFGHPRTPPLSEGNEAQSLLV